ncbi:uncharacterized protein LOC6540882 [Drosophila erecta]|uniref:Uncharacterized protein n=1 Tax=Drosophila erecta TaxID=7220 RepID=B3N8X9_DROER|nr:uncharacterized protein LOC6540882 [Drosophila erecta]EDV57379.1 uncharacterized protein Dere_GG24574 [Drosophila erecta]
MNKYVNILFTEDPLEHEEDYNRRNQAPGKVISTFSPRNNQENDIEMNAPPQNEAKRPILNSSNFNKIFGASAETDDFDFEDFPDLNHPHPNVSICEQLRLTSVNRGIILSIQRNHQKRLEDLWHSQLIEKCSSGHPFGN